MGVPRDEILSGLARLLQRLGLDGVAARDGETVRFEGPAGLTIEVGPMPEERITYPVLFPRTRVVIRGEEAVLAGFYPEFLRAFLRPTG